MKSSVPLIYLIVEAWDTIGHNKMRTFLTMLGMNIGVGAIIAIISLGLMAREAIMSDVGEMGASMVWIYPDRDVYQEWERPVRLTPEDSEALKQILPRDIVMPRLSRNQIVNGRGKSASQRIYGVNGLYNSVWKYDLTSGRFISEDDNVFKRKSAVLGDRAAASFFGDRDPLGENIVVEERVFTIVGVLKERKEGIISDGSDGNTIFIPYETYREFYNYGGYGRPYLNSLTVNITDISQISRSTQLIENYLIRKYGFIGGEKRFVVEQAKQSLDQFNKIFSIITTVISLIAGISLLVSGIGIMNIMLVAITERTKEIGIRKALGAQRKDILFQFLIEAVIICLLGGGIGVLFGMLITFLVALSQNWNFLVPLFAVGSGLGVSFLIGLAFGIIPASQASRLPPVEALSKE